MTDSAITILVGGALTLANIVVGFLMWRTKTLAEAALAQSKENKQQMKETHDVVNSRMDEFKKMAEKFFHQEGVMQEQQDEQARQALIASTLAAAPAPAVVPTPIAPVEMKIVNTPEESVPTFIAKPEAKK